MRAIGAVFYREFLLRLTSMTWLFFDLFMPLLYLLIFGIGFDRAFQDGIFIGDAQIPYADFFLGGILAMASFGIGVNTSYGFFTDRDNGILYEHLTYPLTRGQFLIGKVFFNCCTAVTACTLAILVGVFLLNISFNLHALPLIMVGIIIGTAGWFFFLTIFALRIRRNDMYNAIINVIYFVMLFASSLFYPLDLLPPWLKTAAKLNPVTWQSDYFRYLTIQTGDLGTIMAQSVYFIIFVLISFYVGVRTIKRLS